MISSERFQALQVLLKVFSRKTSLAALPADCTPFTQALCYGLCREYYRIAAIADQLLKKRPQKIELWTLLLMGLFELYRLDQPEYAVVKTYVDLVPKKYQWAKGLLNATLRTYCRIKTTLLTTLQDNNYFIFNHPDWLLIRLQSAYPNDWRSIIKANDQHPPMVLRVNRLYSTRADYLTRLNASGIEAHAHTQSNEAIVLTQPCDVKKLPDFYQGACSVQDAAAQLAVSLLSPKPNTRILDACCAPGGKTTHLLESIPTLNTLLALDIEAHRIEKVRENLTRLGLIDRCTLLTADAIDLDSWWDGHLFDSILLDAPCSATGVIRRHPDIKYLRTEEELCSIAAIQGQLLNQLWTTLAPYGRLLYVTCSVLPEENEQQIAHFLKHHPEASCIPFTLTHGHPTPHGWQLLPGSDDMDGFFYSLLEKRGSSASY